LKEIIRCAPELAAMPPAGRAAIGVFKRWVNIRKRLASGIQENLANGLADGFVGPVWYDLNP
jgi:hypothetical protein